MEKRIRSWLSITQRFVNKLTFININNDKAINTFPTTFLKIKKIILGKKLYSWKRLKQVCKSNENHF